MCLFLEENRATNTYSNTTNLERQKLWRTWCAYHPNNSFCSIIEILLFSFCTHEEMIISELVRIHVLKEYIADGEGPPNSMVEKVWEACG